MMLLSIQDLVNALPVSLPLFIFILGYVVWVEYANMKGWKSPFQRHYDHWISYASHQVKQGNLHPMFRDNKRMWDDWSFEEGKRVPPFTPEDAPDAWLHNHEWLNGEWVEKEQPSLIEQWKNLNQPEFG